LPKKTLLSSVRKNSTLSTRKYPSPFILLFRLKALQEQLELLDIQEEYIKEEYKNLKRELISAQEEVKRIRAVPLTLGQFNEMIDNDHCIISLGRGTSLVRVLSTIDRELLKPSSIVALHRHSSALVEVLPPESDNSVKMMTADTKPDVTYQDIGNCDSQKQVHSFIFFSTIKIISLYRKSEKQSNFP
jgi:26S proteasome regulatory subunit T3